jgi:hypothetical protein
MNAVPHRRVEIRGIDSATVYFAVRLAESGSGNVVHLQNYKSMPHVFILFEKLKATATAYETTTTFVGEVSSGKAMETKLEVVNGKGVVEGRLDSGKYPIQVTKEEVSFPRKVSAEVCLASHEDGRVCCETESDGEIVRSIHDLRTRCPDTIHVCCL